MQMIEVVASPAERFALFEVVFQRGPRALRLNNGAEGRAFRSFVEGIGLVPIREALARFGKVSADLAGDESTFHVFRLTPEAVQLYREKVADLPRSAVQELVGGALFSSLHGLGGVFHRDAGFKLPEGWQPILWQRQAEAWAPAIDVPAEALETLTVRAKPIQEAMERLQTELEGLDVPALPFTVKAALLRFEEAVLLATKEALERPGADTAMDSESALFDRPDDDPPDLEPVV